MERHMHFRLLAVVGLLLGSAATATAQASATIPAGLKDLKPHEVIEQVLHKQVDLGLSQDQVARLTDWHERVADEPHRFKHDPSTKPHDVTHMPMVSRQEAFDSTIAILTPTQRTQLATLFAKRQ
jgi:Spy/CpxP family protein refolding chaperone